jgi:hypothetical protein
MYKTLTTLASHLTKLLLGDDVCVRNASGRAYGGPVSCEITESSMWLVTIYLAGSTALSF